MQIDDFLRMLKGVKGKSGGEYQAICPAHDDAKASLCVKSGEKGIVVKCQAGCSTDAVLSAMGLKMSDLFFEPLKVSEKKPAAKKEAPKAPARAKEPTSSGDLGELVAVYPYTDSNGKVLFEVCRYRPKAFRQRTPLGDGRYTWKVDSEVRDKALYRAVEVSKAIAKHEPVWVVEGEKDADNLAKLGFAATCNAGGAGKWHEGHTQALAGADVIVLCDNDTKANGFRGQTHSWDVATALSEVASRVRFPNLLSVYPDMPEKGDVSDVIEALGVRARATLERLAQYTKTFDPDDVPEWMDLPERIAMMYSRVGGFCVDNGCICSIKSKDGDETKSRIANFTVLPRAIVSRDDGVNVTQTAVIDGWTSGGTQLPTVTVPTDQFDGMAWVTRSWDFRANIAPGNQVKDKLRYVISEVGRKSAQRWTEYTHTGWRKIDGKWCYLHGGGAIGADDVTVALEAGLEDYTLETKDEISVEDGIRAALAFLRIMSPKVAIPLLAVAYLAPLREFLLQGGDPPAFALFLVGGTQTRKSTACALALSHFGQFRAKKLPASFNDTSNYIRKKAFLLKDCLFCVDDYHPVSSMPVNGLR